MHRLRALILCLAALVLASDCAPAATRGEIELTLDLSDGRGEHVETLLVDAERDVALADARTLHARLLPRGSEVALENGGRGLVIDAHPAPAQSPAMGRVVGLSRHVTSDIVRVRTASELLETTPDHPFFVVGRGWTGAGDLAAGDRVAASTREGAVTLIAVERARAAPRIVFNLLVEGDHTFRVGADGLLVHNGGCFAWLKNPLGRPKPAPAPSYPPDPLLDGLPMQAMPAATPPAQAPPTKDELLHHYHLTPAQVGSVTAWTRESTAYRILEGRPETQSMTWDQVNAVPELHAKLDAAKLRPEDWHYYQTHLDDLHAFQTLAPKAPGRVYRGLNRVPASQIAAWTAMPIGAPFPLGAEGQNGSASATHSPGMANLFTNLKDGGYRVIVVIDQHSGTAIENVALAQFKNQEEVLLPPGARFTLSGVSQAVDTTGDVLGYGKGGRVVLVHVTEAAP